MSVRFRTIQMRREQTLVALDNVSLNVKRGECLAVVGGSGSGKSTLARVICGLIKPVAGTVDVEGYRVSGIRGGKGGRATNVQMVFQDPYSSLDPLWSIRKSIVEAFLLRFGGATDDEGRDPEYYLRLVGLSPDLATRKPRQLSGGQVQRAGIARGLAAKPSVLIMDEAVSSLDVSVQAQILHLIDRIKRTENLTIIFIVHNLAVAAAIADRIAVFDSGRLVEIDEPEKVFRAPSDDYTRKLINAIPKLPKNIASVPHGANLR